MKIYVWLARLILAVLVFMLVALVARCVPSEKSHKRQVLRDSRRLELARKRSPELFKEETTLKQDSGTAHGRELSDEYLDSLLSELCPNSDTLKILVPYQVKGSEKKRAETKKAIKYVCTICALMPAQTIRTENDATVTVKPAANCKDLVIGVQNWRVKETIFQKISDFEAFGQVLQYVGCLSFIMFILGFITGRSTKK